MKMSRTDFFNALKESKQALLLLDYDGTLAPLVRERKLAFPYPGVKERLEAILNLNKTKVVIISGRSIENLLTLLHLNPLPEIWGSHGAEKLCQGQIIQTPDFISENALRRLQEAKEKTAQEIDPRHCEEKPLSIAIHWRGLSEKEGQEIKDQALKVWRPFMDGYPLEALPFKCGIELRPVGVSKAIAVKHILEEHPKMPTAYLGDDLTDEEAFAALNGNGLKVLVSEENRATGADITLKPPEELLAFFDEWLHCQGKG